MAVDVIGDTCRVLAEHAASHPACLVAFSGGKDSLAVLDLCCRAFKKVAAFYLYLVPGLRCVEAQMNLARERWGVEVLCYPHPVLLRCLRRGVYCPNPPATDDLPLWGAAEMYRVIQAETGINLIASGAKKKDYWSRSKIMSEMERSGVIHPLRLWNKFEVLAYLRSHNIPEPGGHNTGGVDLSNVSLLWLHDHHPDDFARLLEYFPYAEAAVQRRAFFGAL